MPPRRLQGQQGQPPTTQGQVHAVPCPHCGKANDFRELDSQQLLDTGHDMICDSCGRMMQVAGIRQIKVIVVRPIATRPKSSAPAPRQATTMSPGQVRKLLRR